MPFKSIPQGAERAMARLVAFAGIKTERTLHCEIVRRPPTGKCREIVGVETHEGIGCIPVRRKECAIVVAFEQHDAIGKDTPIGHCLAEAIRHGAKILANDHTGMRLAVLRDYGEKPLEWHLG